jgi:hypothetical protein
VRTLQQPNWRRWTNARIERAFDLHRARWLVRGSLGLLVAVLPAVTWILLQNECLRLSYELTRLRVESERLEERERRLMLEQAELEALDGIEAWAERSGFVRPLPDRVFVVQSTFVPAGEPMASIAAGPPGTR